MWDVFQKKCSMQLGLLVRPGKICWKLAGKFKTKMSIVGKMPLKKSQIT